MERSAEPASEVFAAFLVREANGERVDFEALCAAHPAHGPRLRQLREDWTQLKQVHARLGFSGSLAERLRARFGPDVDPGIALGGEEPRATAREPDQDLRLARPGGRYEVLGKLGAGGQGEVLEVWDENLRRPLAMKVVDSAEDAPDPAGAVSRKLARLLEEAHVTGQLDHPGIVPVHELGLDPRGRVYFTMKLVKGKNLHTAFEQVQRGEDGWTQTRALHVILRVCEAMSYAHAKGVVHRDLKPANVMVGRFGEVYVMDWGLARVQGVEQRKDVRLRLGDVPATSPAQTLELLRAKRHADPDSPLVTMDGDVVGTPAYMAPEQARGELEAVGPRSDVYALGAILYHLLAGRTPYVERDERVDNYVILARVLAGPPRPLAELAPESPPALLAIVEKAMGRDVGARYGSMLALADDLRAYLEGRVVRAYEGGLKAEVRQWVKRNRALSAAIALVATLVLGGAVAGSYLQNERLEEARWGSYAASLGLAERALSTGNRAEVLRLLQACPEEHRGWEWRRLDLERDLSSRVLRGHTAELTDVAFAPDERRAATASKDGSVRVWDLESGASTVLERLEFPVFAVIFSADGRAVVSGADDHALRVRALDTGSLVGEFALSDAVLCLASDERGRIAAGCRDGQIALWGPPWKTEEVRIVADPKSYLEALHTLAFGPGDSLVAASRTGTRLWDLAAGTQRSLSMAITDLAATRGGVLAWGSDLQGKVFLRRGEGAEDTLLSGIEPGELCIALAPDGTLVARGSRSLTIWDTQRAQRLAELAGHEADITALEFSSSGARLLSGSTDETARLWLAGARATNAVGIGEWPVAALAFVRGGAGLAVLGVNGQVLELGARDGTFLFEARQEDLVVQINLPEVQKWTNPELERGSAAWSADGTRIALGGLDGRIELCDARSGALLRATRAHAGQVTCLSFWGDELLISGGVDEQLKVWELDALEEPRITLPLDSAPTALAVLPGDARLACGKLDGALVILDLKRQREVQRWQAFVGPVTAVAFAPDGTRLALGSTDERVRIWHVARGVSLLTVPVDARPNALAFSPDGARLAVGEESGQVSIFETELASAVDFAPRWDQAPRQIAPPAPPLVIADKVLLDTANTLIARFFEKHLLLADVVEALRQDPSLSAELRELATQLARAHGELSPERLDEIAREIVVSDERSPSTYRRALRAARAACERQPGAGTLVTVAAAEFRSGDPTRALATLERALDSSFEPSNEERLRALLFRGLARVALGAREDAGRDLAEARTLLGSLGSAAGNALEEELKRALEASSPR